LRDHRGAKPARHPGDKRGVALFGNPPEIEPAAIDRLIDINVRGPYHAAVDAGQRMNDNGRIIVIGSVNGDRMPFQGGAAYALSKSAVQGLVRGLARDFGGRGITVNNVSRARSIPT
jgi:cyclic-di-GMP-binding biofilm dispersal mediator protein